MTQFHYLHIIQMLVLVYAHYCCFFLFHIIQGFVTFSKFPLFPVSLKTFCVCFFFTVCKFLWHFSSSFNKLLYTRKTLNKSIARRLLSVRVWLNSLFVRFLFWIGRVEWKASAQSQLELTKARVSRGYADTETNTQTK